MTLPECPVCREHSLRPVNYVAINGLHYMVVCDSCGVHFEHADFYGINNVETFFEEHRPSEKLTEDISTTHGIFLCKNCSCRVEEDGVDNGLLNFCPDCGFGVER